MNLIYLIAAHKNPAQVVRLIDRLDSGNAHFFLHISRKKAPAFRNVCRLLQYRQNCYLVEQAVVRWGDFGLVRACLNGLRAIRESRLDYDFVVLLSGQDYPIKSNAFIEGRLAACAGEQLMENFPLPHVAWGDAFGVHRLERYYFWLGDRAVAYPLGGTHRVDRRLANMLLSPFIPKSRALPDGFKPYGGSVWWCLSRGCLEFIDDFVETEIGREIASFYNHTWGSAEMFFQTVVMNSPWRASVVNDDMRYIDWAEGGSRPKTLGKGDFAELAASEKLFARKFDSDVDEEILDLIDSNLPVEKG